MPDGQRNGGLARMSSRIFAPGWCRFALHNFGWFEAWANASGLLSLLSELGLGRIAPAAFNQTSMNTQPFRKEVSNSSHASARAQTGMGQAPELAEPIGDIADPP